MTTSSAATAPPALDWSTDNCQVARTMAILGERATVEVLREVFNGVRRFDDMHRHSGVARQVLSNRLAMLVGLAWLPDGAQVTPDAEHDEHAWWPADPGAWPEDADPALRQMAAILA